MSTPAPALLAISHGTSSPDGQAAVAGLVAAVSVALPEVEVRLGHVDVQQPDVAASLDALGDVPTVIVPLLLSAGYHVRVDLREQTSGRPDLSISAALGPDPRLIDVLVTRLSEIEGPEGDAAIVLAVAGSSDDRANEDCRTTARMLAERLGRDVGIGFLAAAEPRLAPAVAAAREGGRTAVVANYLLAPGYFHDLAVRMADGSRVARPLLDDDEPPASLVSLVVDRYRSGGTDAASSTA